MQDVRGDFPLLRRRIEDEPIIYLDSAATSLKPDAVIESVHDHYTARNANIHRAVHRLAEEATEAFEQARERLARFLRVEAAEVILTRGATESINLVRQGMPELKRIVTTVQEHHSNFLPWLDAGAEIVGVDGRGEIDLDALDRALAPGADLVAIAHVSNAAGTLNPVRQIVARARERGARVLLDAAQSAAHMPIDARDLDVDFLACSAHKMLGPGGAGMLYGRRELLEQMRPRLLGGEMIEAVHVDRYEVAPLPHRFEAGTPAIEAVIGWGAAVDYLDHLGMDEVFAHTNDLVTYALERLGAIERLRLFGPVAPGRRCGSVAFTVENLEAHGVARMLSNRANIMVRSGFQCAQPLHEALGSTPTVRASFHVYNVREDVDALAQTLEQIAALV
ncbi:MAG: cysteine desulfurase [Phycisphaeraceae bacterium]|nr:cysteine desulfurase [Phycisphaeraceae bacterium]